MKRLNERGMTLVELMIVAVLGALVLAAMYEVLITNQRTYAAQNANSRVQQTLQGGMSVLFGELREVSPGDGDLLTMNANELQIRALREVAIVCEIQAWGVDPMVKARRIGGFLTQGDSVRVFFENDPRSPDDDVWRGAVVDQLDTSGESCDGSDVAQVLQLDGVEAGNITPGGPPDSLITGAQIRSFDRYTYELQHWSDDWYLVREDSNGDVEPLVGPVDTTNGVSFRYLDGSGNTTATPSNVRQIHVTLRTTTPVRGPDGEQIGDSLQARIYTRN